MARSLFRDNILLRGPGGLFPLAGARVHFYEPGSGSSPTPIGYALYPDATSTAALSIPYVTGALGELEVWADQPHRVRIIATLAGYSTADETIDLEYPPEYSASTEDVNAAVAAHEAKVDPHLQYLTEARGDLLYLPIDTTFLDQDEGDLRYEQLTRKGAPSGYAPLGADGLLPQAYLPPLAISDTFVVASEAAMLSLTAQRGDICIRTDTGKTYILAADPASVLVNWTEIVATSGVGGNITVITREEFAPAAAATTVTLAALPTEVLSVTRNGVEQSAGAGHYSVAGQVVTFSDAFASGERVSVVYEVGTSVPADAYTKGESDARYEPIDTMYTKIESDGRYLQPATAASTYLPLTGGTLSGHLLFTDNTYDIGAQGATRPRAIYARGLINAAEGTTSAVTIGGQHPAGIGAFIQGGNFGFMYLGSGVTYRWQMHGNGHWQPVDDNAYDLGGSSGRVRKVYATDAEFTNAPLVGGVALPTAGIAAAYLPLAGGTLTGPLLFTAGGGGAGGLAPAYTAPALVVSGHLWPDGAANDLGDSEGPWRYLFVQTADISALLSAPTVGGSPLLTQAVGNADYADIDHTHPQVTTGEFHFQTNPAMTDPGSGNFRSNTGVAATATVLSMDQIGAGGTDITTLFSAMRTNDTIFVQDKNDAAHWVRYQLTGVPTINSGWSTVPVTVIAGGGTIAGSQLCVMQLTLTAGGGGGGAVLGMWNAPAGTAPKMTVQASAPSSPAAGDLWVW